MTLRLGDTLIAGAGANQDLSNLTSTGMENIIDIVYPVGSLYFGNTATCPLAAIKGTWTLVSSGRVVMGADSSHAIGTTAEAGLPNITGRAYGTIAQCDLGWQADGALSPLLTQQNVYEAPSSTGAKINTANGFSFSAQNSNSIYGNSTTVQPPAYFVNIWERTA